MKSGKEELPAHKRGRKRVLWFGAVMAFLLCLAAFFIHETPKEGAFAWLNPASFARPGAAGPLTQFRRRVESLPGISSLVTRYRRTQPSILIDSHVWKIPPAAGDQAALGQPLATNANGMRVWVLPATVSTNFEVRVASDTAAKNVMTSRIIMLNGTQARMMQAGNWVKSGGNNLYGGLTIDVVGKIFYSSVKLSVGITATKVVAAPDGTPMLKTNLTAGCQVMLPDGGALVIDSGKANDEDGKFYWIVISPSAMDARGLPIGK